MTDRELLRLALAMRAAQRDYYDNGRTKAQLARALELERKFDRAAQNSPRGEETASVDGWEAYNR